MDKSKYHDSYGPFLEQEDENWDGGEKRPRRRGFFLKISAALVLLAFMAGSIPGLSYFFDERLGFLEQNNILRNDQIVQMCRPAVVAVEAVDTSNPLKAATHTGTGFNLAPTGTIITNQHIVSGSSNITIAFEDGQKFFIKNFAPVPGYDLVVIHLNSSDLPAIAIERDEPPLAGDTVTIIGNPLGFQKIAQRGKIAHYLSNESGRKIMAVHLPINPGNSGSPVINGRARVVGIIYGSISRENDTEGEPLALAIPAAVLEDQVLQVDG